MKFTHIILAVLVGLFVFGCGLAEGPREKLARTSFEFQEGLRWGRYNDVLPRVDPEAMTHFSEMHEGWGQNIKISNAEISQTTYDDKEHKALVTVQFTWYRNNEMVVYTTVTNQNWEYQKGYWIMVAEEYVSGEAF